MAEARKTITVGKDTYAIDHKLGYGAFSWAVLAHNTKDGKVVALKFTKHSTGSERAVKRQQTEIQTELDTFTKVRHDNVVALYSYDPKCEYEHGDGKKTLCYCMALECCEGGELFDIVYYTGKLEEKVARTLFAQIVAGIQAMHKVGLCHRDIKPQNILLTSQFQVKIADFGSSKLFNRQELMKTFRVGTKGYQAPEVLLRRGYTLKCDIFSLGVLLFVILTKHPPFRQAVSEDQWFRQIAKKQFASFWAKHPKDKLSRPCKDLICKMLCYQPLDRLTIGAVFTHAWTRADVYSPSQMVKIMSKKKRDATKGRKNDSARCPEAYNSQVTRAGKVENEIADMELKVLPKHLEFRALVSKDHPWIAMHYLYDTLCMGASKAGEGVLDREWCVLTLEARVEYSLGFSGDGGEEATETQIVAIWVSGYKGADDDENSFYIDIAIKSGYSEAAQQLFNTILTLLNMDFKVTESDAAVEAIDEEEKSDLDEIAGEMTEEEKELMVKRKKELDAIKATLDAKEAKWLDEDILKDKPKKKKKKKSGKEEEVGSASKQ